MLLFQMLLQGSMAQGQPPEVSLGLSSIHNSTHLPLPPAEHLAFTVPKFPVLWVSGRYFGLEYQLISELLNPNKPEHAVHSSVMLWLVESETQCEPGCANMY